jgi:semaphorin 3
MEVIDEQLFVGTANSLQVFNLPGLQQPRIVDLSSENTTVEQCSGFDSNELGQNREDCMNFIRTIQRFPGANQQEVLVCGTNAHFPQCHVHQFVNPLSYRKLSAPDRTDAGYSPVSKTHSIQAILADNGNFFTATQFADANSKTAIRMAPGTLQNDTTFTVGTPQDDRWLNTPSFVSVLEYGDHIFFFMSEPALELDGVQEVRYSRAVRICKTDVGTNINGDLGNNPFLTFQKARIVCSVNRGGGSIPFFYNDIASTFLGETENEVPVLYGVFNSPANGPAGGAICKFSFDNIHSVFENQNYLVRLDGENNGGNVVWGRRPAPAFSCPGSSSGQQRSSEDVMTFHLKFNNIVPIGTSTNGEHLPLLVSPAEFLDKIAAETVNYTGDIQEILYYTNKRGDIMQTVLSSINANSHKIYEMDSPNPVKELILHRTGNERRLIAGSSGKVIEIPRGRCASYDNCLSCFDSRDAYCGWDRSGTCINKFERSGLIEVVSASEATIISVCGDRPIPTSSPTVKPVLPCLQNPSTNPSTIEITSETLGIDQGTEEEGGGGCTTKGGVTGTIANEGFLGNSGASGDLEIYVIVGASIGAFLFGLSVGSIICVIFCKCSRGSKSSKKGPPPDNPRDNTSGPSHATRNETVLVMQVNNSMQKSEKIDMVNEMRLKSVPPPRYITHNPNNVQRDLNIDPDPPTDVKTLPANGTLGSTTSLPPVYMKHSNGTINRHQLPDFAMDDDNDSAFADIDKDTLPPLKTFPSTGNMYGSLGRNKTVETEIARKQRSSKVRTESTTRLIPSRQRSRSESFSGDSPLQSPISDV